MGQWMLQSISRICLSNSMTQITVDQVTASHRDQSWTVHCGGACTTWIDRPKLHYSRPKDTSSYHRPTEGQKSESSTAVHVLPIQQHPCSIHTAVHVLRIWQHPCSTNPAASMFYPYSSAHVLPIQQRPCSMLRNIHIVTMAYMGKGSAQSNSKFMDLKYFWIKEQLDKGLLRLDYLDTNSMPRIPADI